MNNTLNNEIKNEEQINREFYEAFRYRGIPLWKCLIIGGGVGGLVGLVMGVLRIVLSELLG